MKKSFSITTGIIGIIVLLATIGVYLLSGFERGAAGWIAIGFVLLAEIAFFAGLEFMGSMGSPGNKVLIFSGVTVTLFFYLAAAIIICLFSRAFSGNTRYLLICEIVITTLAAIIVIIVESVSNRINAAELKNSNGLKFVKMCEDRIYSLLTAEKDQELREKLNSLYEDIKYSDKSAESSGDEKISIALDKLEQGFVAGKRNENEIYDAICELSALINKRKAEIAESKVGGF